MKGGPGSDQRPGIGQLPKLALLSPTPGIAALAMMLTPIATVASEVCPPPPAPPGFSLTPDGRVFHGSPTIEILQLAAETAIPCQAISDHTGSLCGPYRLRYSPWDPYPELASVLIRPQSGRGERSQRLRGRGETAVLIACHSLPVALSSIGERSLRVRTTRKLVMTMVEPIKLHRSEQETSRRLVIRESFLSSYPLVRADQKAS